jgi:hypothetical protein
MLRARCCCATALDRGEGRWTKEAIEALCGQRADTAGRVLKGKESEGRDCNERRW